MSISARDRQRISAAIRAAKAKASGEIVCVVAQGSCDATAFAHPLSAMAALALP
jgi:putative membrane protein